MPLIRVVLVEGIKVALRMRKSTVNVGNDDKNRREVSWTSGAWKGALASGLDHGISASNQARPNTFVYNVSISFQ